MSLDGTDFGTPAKNQGAAILGIAIQASCETIAENAGKNGEEVVKKVAELKGNMGYNAKTDTYEDLMEAKIMDPVKVLRKALENAASAAAMFLTLDCGISNAPTTASTDAPASR